MRLQRHVDPVAFLAAATPLVARGSAFAALLQVLVAGFELQPEPERCLMATWTDGGGGGVAFQRNDGPLVLDGSAFDVTTALAAMLADEHPELEAVTGSLAACETFAHAWHAATGRIAKQRMHMRNHVLTRLVAPVSVPGSIRVANLDDRDRLLAMFRAFAVDARVPVNNATLQRQMDERLEAEGYRIWEVLGECTAFAGFRPAGPTAARIAPVYTLPAFRGRGYASALVGALCSEILRSREAIFLVTDLSNPVSNAIYRRLGFEPLDETYAFDFVDPC